MGWGFCPECEGEVTPAAVMGGWEAYSGEEEGEVMMDWRLEGLGIERLCTVGEYRGPLRKALVKLKYGNGRYLARPLARMLSPELAGVGLEGAVLVPVPLHPKRQRTRGYIQSALLARELARELKATVLEGALKRRTNTPPQVGLTAAQRRLNIRGAFVAEAGSMEGRQVVIVDDVATTGATVLACARACHLAGAPRLYVAVVAHG